MFPLNLAFDEVMNHEALAFLVIKGMRQSLQGMVEDLPFVIYNGQSNSSDLEISVSNYYLGTPFLPTVTLSSGLPSPTL